MIESSPKELR